MSDKLLYPANPADQWMGGGSGERFVDNLAIGGRQLLAAPVSLIDLGNQIKIAAAQAITGQHNRPAETWQEQQGAALEKFVYQGRPPQNLGDYAAQAIPSLVNPVEGLEALGLTAASHAPGALEAVTKVLAPFLPASQTVTGAGKAAELGANIGINSTLGLAGDKIANAFTQATEEGQPGSEAYPVGATVSPATTPTADPYFTPDTSQASADPYFTPDDPHFTVADPHFTPYVHKPDDVHRTDLATDQLDDSIDTKHRLEAIALATAGAGLVVAGAASIKGLRGQHPPTGEIGGAVQPGPAEGTGVTAQDTLSQARGPMAPAGAVVQVVDNKAGLRKSLTFLPDGAIKDQLVNDLVTNDSHSIDARVNSFHKTGKIPGSDLRVSKPAAQVVEAHAALPPEKQAAFADVVTLNSAIDQSKAEGYKDWGTGADKLSYQDMVAKRAQLLTAHPEIKPVVEDYHGLFRKMPEYLERQGIITRDIRLKLEAQNPNFAPRHMEYPIKWWQNFMTVRGTKSNRFELGLLDLNKRLDLHTEALRPGEVGDPIKAMVQYFDGMFPAVQINKYRAAYAKAFENLDIPVNGVNKRVGYWAKGEPGQGKMAVPVYKDGQKKYFVVIDPNSKTLLNDRSIYSALMFRPRQTPMILGQIQSLIAEGLVGPANPLFPPIAAAYDTIMAPLMLPKGRQLGLISKELAQTPGLRALTQAPVVGDIINRLDPTNLAAVPLGMAQKLTSEMKYAGWQTFSRDLNSNGWMSRNFGPQNIQTMADMWQHAFERSIASLAEETGAIGGSRSYVYDRAMTVPEVLSSLPGLKGIRSSIANVAPLKVWNSLVDAAREGTRLQYMAANVELVPVSRNYTFQVGRGPSLTTINTKLLSWVPDPSGKGGQLTVHRTFMEPSGNIGRLASETRRLMGNTGEIGGDVSTKLGSVTQGVVTNTMFANQAIQETAQVARTLINSKGVAATGILGMMTAGLAAWQYAYTQPSVRKQLELMTPEQRGRVVPIAYGDKLVAMVPTPQLFRPFMAAFIHVMLANQGMFPKPWQGQSLPPGEYETPWDAGHVFWTSARDDVFPAVAGPLQWAMAAMGVKGQGAQPSQIQAVSDPDHAQSLSEFADNLVSSVGGATIKGGYEAFKTFTRATAHNLAVRDPKFNIDPVTAAAEAFSATFREPKTDTALHQLWGTDVRGSIANRTWEKVQQSTLPAIKSIITTGAKTVKSAGTRMQTGTASAQGVEGLIPDLSMGKFGMVYNGAKQLDWSLKPLQDQYAALGSQEDAVRQNPVYSDPAKKTIILNDLTRQKSALNNQMLQAIRAREAELSSMLGHPFTFDNWQQEAHP